MMLEHLGEAEAGERHRQRDREGAGRAKLRTRDLGGAANTVACGKAVADALA